MQYTKLRLDRPQLEKAEQDEIRRSAAEDEVVKNLKMFSTMGQIIFCDDLILRVDDKEDLTNVTEWLLESTEYRPASPESCTVRSDFTFFNTKWTFWTLTHSLPMLRHLQVIRLIRYWPVSMQR